MPYPIVSKESLSPEIFRVRILAPEIAKKRKAGQFVVIRLHEDGERIPLTIAGSDAEKGTITLIFQVVGKTTSQFSSMNPGDEIIDVVGPLGKPTHIEKFGTALVVGGGIGIAVALPIATALKAEGNRVVSVIGARSKSLLILEDEIRSFSDEVYISTDDGSYGKHGFVTDVMKQLFEQGFRPEVAFGIGPVPMMAAIARLTSEYKIPTYVSLNPIMVDGTGMCGCCRVSIGGETKFACVDGPEFPADKVDFKELSMRLKAYRKEEERSYKIFRERSNIIQR